MLSNGLTYMLSIIALISYFLYIIVRHGTVGFLFSSAIFLLIAAFVDHIEYITIGLLVIGLTLSIYIQQRDLKMEGFEDSDTPPATEEPVEQKETKTTKATKTTPGVASQNDTSAMATTDDYEDGPAPNVSSNAPAVTKPAIDQTEAAGQIQKALTQLTNASTTASKAAAQPSAASTAASNENFQEPSAGLFKLGELPSEMKKGPFVDVASTMSKAMNSLQPEQMAAMTAESQSLIETQKNLMNMLQSMRPVLQDGRQLLDTFGSIFGSLGGLTGGQK
jgi:hypothetical protein